MPLRYYSQELSKILQKSHSGCQEIVLPLTMFGNSKSKLLEIIVTSDWLLERCNKDFKLTANSTAVFVPLLFAVLF